MQYTHQRPPEDARSGTVDREPAVPTADPPALTPALVARLQRSAGNAAVTALLEHGSASNQLQRHLYKGEKKPENLVDKVADLPDAANRTLDKVHKGPVAAAVLEHVVTSPAVQQPVPAEHWDKPAFWEYYIGLLLKELELVKRFKPDDKLYGVHEARDSVQAVLEGKKIPHPTIDSVNNALGVASGAIKPTGTDPSADKYAAWFDETANRELIESPDLNQLWTNIKRSCKAAISYTTGRGAHIHFELAGLNIKSVLEERKQPKQDRRITGVELRSLYRSFFRQAHDLTQAKGREVNMSGVTFYLNGQPVKPPWEWPEGKDLWNEYAQELTPKSDVK